MQAKKILLVDDDRLVLRTFAAGLVGAGFDVSQTESAEEAQELLVAGLRPDMALLDVRMPGQGGLQLAQRLHELDHIPFMMLSAYGDAATVAQATACGALGYLVKPVDVHQLVPAIEAALARSDELGGLRATREQLQTALDQERDINVAVGIAIVQHRLTREGAFDLMRTTVRKRRCRLADVAQEIIAAQTALNLT